MQNLGGTKKPSTLAQVRREWVQDIRKQPGNLRSPSTATSQVLGKKCWKKKRKKEVCCKAVCTPEMKRSIGDKSQTVLD